MAKKIDKSQLGSGVRALFSNSFDQEVAADAEKVVKDLAHTVAMIPVRDIDVNPHQPRREFDEEGLQELAASLKVHGLIQPITVRRLSPHEYQLISGERRLRAARLAGLKELPAYIRIANDQELMEMALVENIQREDLNAMEVAFTYHRLIEEFDLTHEQLAERVGKERSTVTNYLRLLDLHIEITDALKKDRISMGHARALAGLEDKLLQKKVLDEVLTRKLSVRETEKLVRSHRPSARKSAGLPAEYEAIQQNLRQFFGSGRIQLRLQGKGKGQIVLPFSSVDELNRLLDHLEE